MKAPVPDDEEALVVDYIYNCYLIDSLETDLSIIPDLSFKIPEAHEGLIETTLKKVRADQIKVKKNMRSLNIRVDSGYMVNEDFIEYPYFVRGYEGLMRFWLAAMAFEGSNRLMHYFKSK